MKKLLLIGILFLGLIIPNINVEAAESIANQLKSLVVTSGDGLYEDEYEEGRYIYKGTNPNNYITFNDELWRIIAIEADGTLKIMRNESIGDMQFDPIGNRTDGYCSKGYAPSYGCNAWAAMDYFSIGGIHYGKVTADSYLNAYLNGEYYDSLSSTAKSLIVSYTYNIGGVSNSNADSTSYTISNQLADEDDYKWTGKVALINLSDYIRSNSSDENNCNMLYGSYSNYETCRNTTWMYNGSSYWTITPNSSYTYIVWFARSFGYVRNDYAYNPHSVYPVVHITSDLTLTNLALAGSGTIGTPYLLTYYVDEETDDETGYEEQTTDESEDDVLVVDVPSTALSVSITIIILGTICVVVSLIVTGKMMKQNK